MLTRAALRAFSTQKLKVVHDVAKQQFVVKVNDDEAVLGYERYGNTIRFIHTAVPTIFQGKGVGQMLANSAFTHAMKEKLDVKCECEFLAHYYAKNKNTFKNLKIEFEL